MTATATRTDAPAAAGWPGPLTGLGALVRFIARRDRVRLPVWLVALTGVTVASAASFADLYPTAAARATTAETMNTPAGLAMSGPAAYLADYSVGSMMAHQMLGFTALLAALMSVLLVVRHTRAEEEAGRAELIGASVVGRHAPMAAALTVAVAANIVLAALLGLGMGALGLDGVAWAGSALYGAAHAAVGIAFAGVAAVAAQITAHARGAAGLGLALIGLAYVLRAAGDISTGALSWLSPIGWAQATYVYVDDRWWPLALALGTAAALVAAALALSTRRDVGAGLRHTRPGPPGASATLVHPVGLALRLQRGLLVGFVAGMVLLGLAYGSILGEVETMLTAVEGLEEALADLGGATLVESYVSMIMTILAILAAVYGVLAALRPRAEESAGRAEPLLATALSRGRWAGGHVAVALVGSAALQVAGGLTLGVVGAAVLGDAGLAGELTAAALAYVPAVWVTVGVATALYGLAPRAATLAWIVPVYAFFVGYLGQILQFPAWMANVSPFGHVPAAPAEDLAVAPLAALTLVAAALLVAGWWALGRRDLALS